MATFSGPNEITSLQSALAKGRKFKLRTPQGQALEQQLVVAIELRTAIAECDWDTLRGIVKRAVDIGRLNGAECKSRTLMRVCVQVWILRTFAELKKAWSCASEWLRS